MRCLWNCIERPLSRAFGRYGRLVARHPYPFLLIPILVAATLGSGMYRLDSLKMSDVEYLFTPEHGRAKEERRTTKRLFSTNDSGAFDATRMTTLGKYGRLIIVPSLDGENILQFSYLKKIIDLHNRVLEMSVNDDKGGAYTYDDVCATWQDSCAIANPLFFLLGNNASKIADLNLTYPTTEVVTHIMGANGLPTQILTSIFLGSSIGGVIVDESNLIISANALNLVYYLDSQNKLLADTWESTFLDTMKKWESKNITVAYYSSQTLEKELGANTKSIIPLFSVTFTVVITFSVVTCIMKDWVRSKPWLGQIGVVSAGLAIVSSFGLMLHAGVPFIDIVASTPFLILAIGVDDMFIMIAAWRQTNPRNTVEKRMGETFSEAAVSITITTLTDGLSFGIGAITDFPSVRIFCLYTGVAVLFDFFFQITFFAASMVFIGRREAANRHCMVCTKVIPKDEAENRSKIFRIFCTGGTPSKKKEGEDLNQHVMMEFFRDYYGPFLNKIPSKVSVILVYVTYLGIAIWGITGMKEGLKLKNLADDASYASSFYNLEDKYFKEFGPKISVILEGPLDYWDGTVQTELFHLTKTFEDERNIFDNDTTEFWLRDFLSFIEQYNLTVNETNFVNVLKRQFLPRNEKFSLDIHLDNNTDKIMASRFLVQSVRTTTASREKELVLLARHLADNANFTSSVTAFHPAFLFYDQYVAIMPNTLQNIGIALGSMIVISLLLIPNPICSLWVALSVASIEAGVVGYMVWWDVSLDSVSMINLIMCIGFSVDFSAHIAYAYISANGCTEKKLSSSLFSLGFPILQGALSTILGVLALSASSVYIFRTFFKIMFMVILFGAFHGLVLLPVLLSIFMPGTETTPHISQLNSKQKGKVQQRSKSARTLVAFDFSPTLRKWMNEVSRPSLYGVTNGHSCETRSKSEPTLDMNGVMPYTITSNVQSEQFYV